MGRMKMNKLSVVVAVALMMPVLAYGVDVTVQIQSNKHIPEITQYWDDTTTVPPWVANNGDAMNADWGPWLGTWTGEGGIANGVSQNTDGTIQFNHARSVCADDVYNQLQNAVLAAVIADNFLLSARVTKMELTVVANGTGTEVEHPGDTGNFSFVTSALNEVILDAFPANKYPFSATKTTDGSIITLAPTGVAPDLAPLFKSDFMGSKCATNNITVIGTIPTTEVTFNVTMTLDVKTSTNSETTQEEIAQELLDQFDAAGGQPLDLDEVQLIWPGITQEQFNDLDANGDGVLDLDELEEAAEEPRCGCFKGCDQGDTKSLKDLLGDYLLVGLSLIVLLGFAGVSKRA